MTDIKIIFIIGTFVEQKCGVSDYVKRICTFLDAKGYKCTCIAINDNELIAKKTSYTELTGTKQVEIHRLSNHLALYKRIFSQETD